ARQDEDPVGQVRQRRPDLLARDQPVAGFGIAAGAGADVAEVGAGGGFRIALRPEFRAGKDAGQEAALLLVRTEGDQRRTDQPLADMAEAAGTAGAGILLLED